MIEPSSISLVSIGLIDSYDMKNAISGSTELGMNLYKLNLTEKSVMDSIQSLKRLKSDKLPLNSYLASKTKIQLSPINVSGSHQ